MTSLRPAGTRFLVSCFAVILGLIVPACGESGPTLGQVSGKVTYEDKPLTKGTVSFVSTDSSRPNANGTITPDGSYTLHTPNLGSGAVLGDYEVFIATISPDEYNTPLPGTATLMKKAAPVIPKKYGDPKTSGLKETVKSGTNTINFDLK